MAFDLGSAILWLKGDSSQLDKSLTEGEQKAKSWSGSVNGFLGNAFSFVAGGLITKGIDAVASSIGGLVGGMIDGNAEFEGYNTRFATMLGSADAAQQRMDELAKFGASTPFDLPGVVEADIVLQGFGLHSEEALEKFKFSGEEIRTIAGDVASGTGSDFKEMSLLIGKFSSGATGEAISRMQELGITNRDELTKMGLEFSASGQLLSPLPESMQVVLKLMKDKYGGLMDAQSSTFDGMKSNLQDWVAGSLRTIGAPIFEVLKDKLGDLVAFLGKPETQAAVQSFADMLSQGLAVALDVIIPAVSDFIDIVGNLISYFQMVVEDGDYLNDFLTNLPLPMQGVILVIGTLIAGITGLAATFQSGGANVDQYATIFALAQTFISGAVDGIMAVVGAALAQIAIFWANNGAEITAFVSQAWTQILEIVEGILRLLNATVIPLLAGIAAFIGSHTAEIQAIFSAAWSVIQSVIQGALNIIQGIVKAVTGLITGDMTMFTDGLKQIVEGAFGAIKGIIEGAMNAAKAAFSMTVDAFVEIANSLGANISEGVADGISGAASAILDAMISVVDSAFDWAMEFLGIASPSKRARDLLGEPIGMGVADGIRNSIRFVLEAAGDLGEETIKALEDIADKAGALVGKLLDSGLQGKASLARTKIDYMDAGDEIDAELDELRASLQDRANAGGADGELAKILLAGTPASYKAQADIDVAQADAIAKTDPAKAAEFLAMRKQQSLEDLELRKEFAEAETHEERVRIQTRMQLLQEAHRAEMALYEIHEADNLSQIQELSDEMLGIDWEDKNGIGDTLAITIRDALEAANIGGGDTFQVNAQGSMWTKAQLEQIIKDAVDARAREAAANRRN